jgi:hypothetical protein
LFKFITNEWNQIDRLLCPFCPMGCLQRVTDTFRRLVWRFWFPLTGPVFSLQRRRPQRRMWPEQWSVEPQQPPTERYMCRPSFTKRPYGKPAQCVSPILHLNVSLAFCFPGPHGYRTRLDWCLRSSHRLRHVLIARLFLSGGDLSGLTIRLCIRAMIGERSIRSWLHLFGRGVRLCDRFRCRPLFLFLHCNYYLQLRNFRSFLWI